MAQIFPRYTNAISKASIFGGVIIIAFIAWLALLLERSSYMTQAGVVREQPVQFSHEHHVAGLGMDCRYCHHFAETSPSAGMPASETCMNCHSQIWNKSPMLAPVRESFQNNTPIEWTRVHDLPDHVYFDHSIHVNKGIGCSSCHGAVEQMPLAWREPSLYMEWCLNCHRHPERFVRPKNEVFNMHWKNPENQLELGRKLVHDHQIKVMTDCSVCHR